MSQIIMLKAYSPETRVNIR